jgi:hypothetical protein
MPADGSQFVILKTLGTVPLMGGCAVCGCKFFTPPVLLKDAVAAETIFAESSTATSVHHVRMNGKESSDFRCEQLCPGHLFELASHGLLYEQDPREAPHWPCGRPSVTPHCLTGPGGGPSPNHMAVTAVQLCRADSRIPAKVGPLSGPSFPSSFSVGPRQLEKHPAV